jgi:hypothetical protein
VLSGALPIAPRGPHAPHAPSDDSKVEMHSAQGFEGDNRTKILYFSLNPVCGKCVKIIRQQGHDLVTANSITDTLAMMRSQIFDALVMDCAQYSLDTLNFMAKAQGLQPSLAVFLADEWGDELATGLEELDHVLKMVVDDEFARLAVEGRSA